MSLLKHFFELVIPVHVSLSKIVFCAVKRIDDIAFLKYSTLVSGIFLKAANTPIVYI